MKFAADKAVGDCILICVFRRGDDERVLAEKAGREGRRNRSGVLSGLFAVRM